MSTGRTSTARTPTLFARQRELLRLLDALGGTADLLDFQMLLFLYCQESAVAPYDFVPHKLGAFSFTADVDRRKLIERGLLETEDNWKITAEGRKTIEGTMDMHLVAFVKQHGHLHGDALVASIFQRFPFYATRSEIAQRFLEGDADALAGIIELRQKTPGPALSTIGYEGHSLESYLTQLLKNGVTLLCDVRRNPFSRKFGFSKNILASGCDDVGIRYEHLPELGIASDQRQTLTTQAEYDALFVHYKRTWLPTQGAALKKILTWIGTGRERVALTCYEHLPHQCHRHCVAEALENEAGEHLTTTHL